MRHNLNVLWVWLIIVLVDISVPQIKPSSWLLWFLQRRINFSGKGRNQPVWGKAGLLQLHLSGLLSFSAPTSPSLDSSLSSVLQVASILPASAFISTPFGASITRDRVGDSNLKYIQD